MDVWYVTEGVLSRLMIVVRGVTSVDFGALPALRNLIACGLLHERILLPIEVCGCKGLQESDE